MNTGAINVAATRVRDAQPRLQLSPMLVAAIAASVALCIQSLWVPIDADVSWLISVSERVLAGERLYADILEVNPPASVWLYLPLVWLAQLAGAKPEAVIATVFAAAGLLSVYATGALASRLDDAPRPLLLAAAVSFVCLVLPMGLFAQREHAALLLAFPSLTALALLAEGKPLGRRIACATGFAAGLMVVIKPYFLAAVVLPALWVAIKRRSLRPLLTPIASASVAIALYGGALFLFAESYFELLRTITRTYGVMHDLWWKVAFVPAVYPAICLILTFLLRPARVPRLAIVWALGALGFLLAAYAQAKNYPNHWFPQAALALAALFVVLRCSGTLRRRKVVGVALTAVVLCEMYNWAIIPDPKVEAAIRQSAPPAPRIIALSPNLVTGHPVTRNVGGEWVGSRAALFTAAAARFAGLDDPAVLRAYHEDIASFSADVHRGVPDVVLVHAPAKTWLMREPEIARAMRGYRFETRVDTTEVWLKRELQR